MAMRRSVFAVSQLVIMVVILCGVLLPPRSYAATSGSWSAGVGIILSGFPAVALNTTWHASENVGVIGEVALGLDTCGEPTLMLWLRSGVYYELPITAKFNTQVSMNLSQLRVINSDDQVPIMTMIEAGIGGSSRLSERYDLLGELRLAHFMSEKSSSYLIPVGLQLGLRYYP